jgi:hypothetical protein
VGRSGAAERRHRLTSEIARRDGHDQPAGLEDIIERFA